MRGTEDWLRAVIRRVRRLALALVAMGLPLGGCGDDGGDRATSPASDVEAPTSATASARGVEAPSAVTCGTQYRPVYGRATGEEQDSITVERPTSDTRRDETSVAYEDFDLSITYSDDGHESPSLLVHVASSSGADVERVLYQFGASPPSFVGPSGFTGLHYVYSDDAELQWWCTAQE